MKKNSINTVYKLFLGLLLVMITFTAISCTDASADTAQAAVLSENNTYLQTPDGRLTEYIAYMEDGKVTKYEALDSSSTVTISTQEAATIYVRTESRNLIIDAPNADVYHYGSACVVTINKVKTSSYHGYALVTNELILKEGYAELNAEFSKVLSYATVDLVGGKIVTYKAMSDKAVLNAKNNSEVSYVEKAEGVTTANVTQENDNILHNSGAVSPESLILLAQKATPIEAASLTTEQEKSQTTAFNQLLNNIMSSFIPKLTEVTENELVDVLKQVLDSQKYIDSQIASSIHGTVELTFDGKFAVHHNNVDGIKLTVNFYAKSENKPLDYQFTDTEGNKLEIDYVYLVYLLQQSESVNLEINRINIEFSAKGTSSTKAHSFTVALKNDADSLSTIKISRNYINIENVGLRCQQADNTSHYLDLTLSTRINYKLDNEENQIKVTFNMDSASILTTINFTQDPAVLRLSGIVTVGDCSVSGLAFDKTNNNKLLIDGLCVDFGTFRTDISLVSSPVYSSSKVNKKNNSFDAILESDGLELTLDSQKKLNVKGSVAGGVICNTYNYAQSILTTIYMAMDIKQFDGHTPVWSTTSAVLGKDCAVASAEQLVKSISQLIDAIKLFF